MSAAVSFDPLVMQAHRSLEWRLTDPAAFGLTTASPLQRAICRIAEGLPLRELAKEPAVMRALGGAMPPRARPRELAILSGIRVAKSLIAACAAVHLSQTCDLSQLGPGEIPRIPVVSLTKDLGDVIFAHVLGRLRASPILQHLIAGEPTADSLMLRHPTGRLVELCVSAGARAGASLVARWLAGVIFDEFPRMVGGEEHVINWDDQRASSIERLLPSAQMIHIGSPWRPDGPAYDMVQDHWGKPTEDLVVIKAPGPDMNPVWWTPSRVEAAKRRPDTYRTECLGEFASAEESFLAADAVQRAIRPETAPEPGLTYVATMDPAMRSNAWTLGIFTRQGRRKRMVAAREWRGSRSEPLSPRQVFEEGIAPLCRTYGVTTVETDQYYIDALQDIARGFGLMLSQVSLSAQEKTERWQGIRARLEDGEVELVDAVRGDLVRLRKKITATGVHIVLPLTGDGRHCDFAPVVMLGIGRWLKDEEPTKKPADPEGKRMLDASMRRYARPREDD
jgi:hypothetical protein